MPSSFLRSAGQSAMACAACRAGEKLYSEYYGEASDFTRGRKNTVIAAPADGLPADSDCRFCTACVAVCPRGTRSTVRCPT